MEGQTPLRCGLGQRSPGSFPFIAMVRAFGTQVKGSALKVFYSVFLPLFSLTTDWFRGGETFPLVWPQWVLKFDSRWMDVVW